MRYLAPLRRYLAIVLVSVIGLTLSGGVCLVVRHWEDQQFETALADSIEERVSAPYAMTWTGPWRFQPISGRSSPPRH